MTEEKKFQRRKETFICDNCGKKVRGDGYTDHCPRCLWSKHVDVKPGDRKEECGALMEPIGVEIKTDKSIIYYKCTKCGLKKRVKGFPQDSEEEIIRLSKEKILDDVQRKTKK